MRRRDFVRLVGGAALAWPVGAQGMAFTREFERLGWADGENVRIDYRWAGGDARRLPSLARQLLDLKPDLIISQGTPGLAAAREATRTLPIIFADVTDPVGQGFVQSLSRPGGNLTGFAHFEFSMGGKWLEVLKSLAPSTKHVAVLFNPPTAPYGNLYFRSVEAAAPHFGIQPSCIEVADETDVERKLTSLGREPNSGLIVLLDAFTYVHRDFIIRQGARHRIPAIYTVPFFTEAGGLVSYGVALVDQFREAAV